MFDYSALITNRNRAARKWQQGGNFLQMHLAEIIALRALEITKQAPKTILDLGCGGGEFFTQYQKNAGKPPQKQLWVNCDISEQLLRLANPQCCLLEPESIPFRQNSFDIIVSINFLHWITKLPQVLAKLQHVLASSGIMLLALPLRGLEPLNAAFEKAGLDYTQHFSPLVDMPTFASLLNRVGFAEPILDKQKVRLEYKEPFAIMKDLRASGQTNCLEARKRALSSKTKMMLAIKNYFDSKDKISIEAEFIIAIATKQ